jgi:Tfp pilus assembly protein PilF
MYAQKLAARDQAEVAISLARINTENFPESYYSFFVLAELYGSSGNTDAAIESYTRAAELNARAKPFLDAKISELSDRQD